MSSKDGAEDVFSLDEIPKELEPQIRSVGLRGKRDQVIGLLRLAGRPLTINEILVGLYRKHGIVEKRGNLDARLYRMKHAGEIANPSTGFYALPDHKKEAP